MQNFSGNILWQRCSLAIKYGLYNNKQVLTTHCVHLVVSFIAINIRHSRYILIACHTLYACIYKGKFIALQLIFVWVVSFLLLVRTGIDDEFVKCMAAFWLAYKILSETYK